MMRPDSNVEQVYFYSKPVDFPQSVDCLTALVELDINVAVFDPVLFVFSTKPVTRSKCCGGSTTAFACVPSAWEPGRSPDRRAGRRVDL